MTIICALHQDGHTWLGADRQTTNAGTCLNFAEKWIVHDPWAVASSGDIRTTTLLTAIGRKLMHDLSGAYEFTMRLREAFEQDAYNTDSDEGPKSYGQQLILAHEKTVWMISPSLGILEIPEGELWADGSGRSYALGAGHGCRGSPEERVTAAVSAAIAYDDGCGGEPWVERL